MTVLQVIRAGKAVAIMWNVTCQIPPPPTPYDPPAAPAITIFDPNGNAQVTAAATTRLAAGLYSYTYVTPAAGPLGYGAHGWTRLTRTAIRTAALTLRICRRRRRFFNWCRGARPRMLALPQRYMEFAE
jgi:hypothetical protein